jgi:hypothetical protein
MSIHCQYWFDQPQSRREPNHLGEIKGIPLSPPVLVRSIALRPIRQQPAHSRSPKRVLSQKSPAYATLPNGYDPLKPNQLSPIYAAAAGEGANIGRQLERKRGHALNILSLNR